MSYSRGGLWTNSEDEILKAAVSKYGLSQWSRCSSLLNRKTAKQCKARWYNWLSPDIDKSEWTPKEDEKLLELASVLHSQWQTIAPLVGRSPNQCIERYQKLVDDVRGPVEESANADLIGTALESKPAKPDAVEMDEDDLEMISEARARLANTMGKKAKRKQRERLLAQTRRVALLQKRRELKSAGIAGRTSLISRKQKKMNATNYNLDVPFEIKPASGVYDVSEEKMADQQRLESFRKQAELQGVANNDGMKKKREPPKRQLVVEGKEQITDLETVTAKRRDLHLPAPKSAMGSVENGAADGVVELVIDTKEELEQAPVQLRAEKMKTLSEDIVRQQQLGSLLTEKSDGTETVESQSIKVSINNGQKKLEKQKKHKTSSSLRLKFAKLPDPKNDFEILVGDEVESDEDELAQENSAQAAEHQKDEDEDENARQTVRSMAVEKGLRMPLVESKKSTLKRLSLIEVPSFAKEAVKLINKELVSLAVSDSLREGISEDNLKDVLSDPEMAKDILPDLLVEEREKSFALINTALRENMKVKFERSIEEVTGDLSYSLKGYSAMEDSEKSALFRNLVSVVERVVNQANSLSKKSS